MVSSFPACLFFSAGGFSLGSVGGTKWELTPDLNEVAPLYEWYSRSRPNADTKTLTATSGGDSLSRDLRFVGTFTALQLGNEPDLPNGRYMSAKARISAVRYDNAIYQVKELSLIVTLVIGLS